MVAYGKEKKKKNDKRGVTRASCHCTRTVLSKCVLFRRKNKF